MNEQDKTAPWDIPKPSVAALWHQFWRLSIPEISEGSPDWLALRATFYGGVAYLMTAVVGNINLDPDEGSRWLADLERELHTFAENPTGPAPRE